MKALLVVLFILSAPSLWAQSCQESFSFERTDQGVAHQILYRFLGFEHHRHRFPEQREVDYNIYLFLIGELTGPLSPHLSRDLSLAVMADISATTPTLLRRVLGPRMPVEAVESIISRREEVMRLIEDAPFSRH